MRPKVSIVAISYNQEAYIAQALDSFFMQKVNFKFEIIIGDDASSDRTQKIISEYTKKYPDQLRPILRKKNIGIEKNLIDVLQHAKGKYIALCEGDDFWTDPEKLQKQVDFMEDHPGNALCFHPVKVFFENNEDKESIWPNLGPKPDLSLDKLLKENYIPTNSVMYKRQDYKSLSTDVMPFDWYLHMFHAQYGKIGFINEVMSSYRRHSGGAWWDSHKNIDKLWIKYGQKMLNLYREAMVMYGGKPELHRLVVESMSDIVNNFINVDKRQNSKLIKTTLTSFPDAAEKLIVFQNEHIQDAKALVKNQNEQIGLLNDEIIDLRSQLFTTRDELHSLKNSRVMGKIIKARDTIGNPYTLPSRVVNKTRRTVAKFVPDSIRLPLMKSLRSGRDTIKARVGHYHEQATNIVTVSNQLWTKPRPLVSVVIPYYNRADTIDDTLDSLRKQTFQNFETIIVDDHSSEAESIKKLKSIEKEGLKVIYQKTNQGVAAARNKGIEATKGKYVICLDSDDMLEETFIEKATITLETNPDVALVTTYQDMFGVVSELFEKHPYDPLRLIEDNMVITAAQFRKEAWETAGGYKSNLGYEDWDFWLQLAENGFWGKLIPEPLFKYRTSMQSRYVEDKDVHWNNIKKIRSLHPDYKSRVRSLIAVRKFSRQVVDSQTAFINLSDPAHYHSDQNKKPNVLITVPWMDFGGVSTLLNNFTREVSHNVNLHFITGLSSKNEWEYKFKEITPRVYHMPNMFEENPEFQLEFVSNYIKTRKIDVLHLVHNGFIYPMLDELKRRHPKLKIISTVFNDRAPYLVQSIEEQKHIDIFATDNQAVGEIYKKSLKPNSDIRVIPNGIDIETIFNPTLFDREKLREKLKISPDDAAVFFIGRLSEEKNPDLFIKAVKTVIDRGVRNVKYFMIGDGPMRNAIQKEVFGIKDRPITYLGYQSDIAKYLAAADVFILPSAVEGFPLSILEAMAMNVATVATNVGAVSDVIISGKNGIIVNEINADSIAHSMEKILNDRKLLDKIKSQTRIDVEKKYSNAILGKNYRKLYKG